MKPPNNGIIKKITEKLFGFVFFLYLCDIYISIPHRQEKLNVDKTVDI